MCEDSVLTPGSSVPVPPPLRIYSIVVGTHDRIERRKFLIVSKTMDGANACALGMMPPGARVLNADELYGPGFDGEVVISAEAVS